MKNLFEITVKSARRVKTLTTPDGALVRGIALQESATAGAGELADGTKPFDGFLTRVQKVGGPDLGDSIYPGRVELPNTPLDPATLEFAEEVEAEGADYVDAGITGATALKTGLSFSGGKFAAATSGQWVEFMLVEKQTPEISGNVRIRAKAVAGYVKP